MTRLSQVSTDRLSRGHAKFFCLALLLGSLAGNSTLAGCQENAGSTPGAENSGRQNPAPWRVDFGETAPANPQSAPAGFATAAGNQPQQPPQQPAIQQPTIQQPAAPNRATELTDRATGGGSGAQNGWQPGTANGAGLAAGNPAPGAPSAAGPTPYGVQPPRAELTSVTKTCEALPNSAGQVWREYDLKPYTSQITGSDHPERAVVEWLTRQTGQQMWFEEPFGFMNASRDKLFVYHTPEIHNQLKPLLDRMINSRGQSQVLDLGLYTVANPNWRATALPAMQPIKVASPGVEAWIVSKENAARLISQLSARADFRSHASGRAITHDGQQFTLEKRTPEQFVRTIEWTPGQGAGYQPVLTQFNEGYTIAVSPLSELDGRTIEVAIDCAVDQIERRTTVPVPVTDGFGQTQRINLQIPQIVSWKLEERVRWPVDQVLILSCGVVAVPDAENVNRPLGGLLDPGSKRADAIMVIDYRGPTAERPDGTSAANAMAPIQRK